MVFFFVLPYPSLWYTYTYTNTCADLFHIALIRFWYILYVNISSLIKWIVFFYGWFLKSAEKSSVSISNWATSPLPPSAAATAAKIAKLFVPTKIWFDIVNTKSKKEKNRSKQQNCIYIVHCVLLNNVCVCVCVYRYIGFWYVVRVSLNENKRNTLANQRQLVRFISVMRSWGLSESW